MITYLCTREHRYTVTGFLQGWGQSLRNQFRLHCYDALPSLPPRTSALIFADIERLTKSTIGPAAALHAQAKASSVRTLNHPRYTAKRYPLLRTLHTEGLNAFRAFRLDEAHRARFPAFVRHKNEHQGPATELLGNVQALEVALGALRKRNLDPTDFILVEYLDTRGEDGLFRKYSAFNVAGQIVPRHLIFSKNWMLKDRTLRGPELLEEEERYMKSNPHEGELRTIFELAGVDYGRIDYALLNGKVQTWEINTNPIITHAPKRYRPEEVALQRWFAEQMLGVYRALL